jgi:hypothetical protein
MKRSLVIEILIPEELEELALGVWRIRMQNALDRGFPYVGMGSIEVRTIAVGDRLPSISHKTLNERDIERATCTCRLIDDDANGCPVHK